MSTLSPFREDVEPAGSMEVVPFVDEDTQEYGETWYTPEPEGSPFAAEAEAWEEGEELDFGEAETEAEAEAEAAHPILALFPLPVAVLDALSGGLSSVAVGLAIGAGFRDVNQLTNIVFYFRHPELIGRKIKPEERDLAAEWISIREGIVKPAVQRTASRPPSSTGTAPAPVVPALSRVVTATVPAPTGDRIPSSGLGWEGATDEQLTFMRAVYDRAVENSKRPERKGDQPRPFNRSLQPDELDEIEGHSLRKEAVPFARNLLAAARAALAAHAPRARIGILSAYRSADEQYMIWQGKNRKGQPRKGKGFPHYYEQMVSAGRLRRGDYGPHAVELMAAEMGGWIAAPGYSNHQDGRAIDFGVGEVGGGLGTPKRGSWFHEWLKANATTYRFHPYWKEAWHWTYREPARASEVWAGEVRTAGVRAGKIEVPSVPLLARHRGVPPDLVLRWNDMAAAPDKIDVVVHLHGYWYRGMELPRDIEPVSGLDLVPIKGASGQGRARPTLTILPRADDTGVRQRFKQKDGSYKYGYNHMKFPALVTKNGLTELVRLSLDRFAAEVGGAAPRVGRLILTAHSGGGQALLEILKHQDPHQVHVFDALYWPADTLADWAQRHIRQDKTALAATDAASAREYMAARGGALRVFFADRYTTGTKPYSRRLREAIAPELGDQLRNWYRVEASKYDHFQIPRRYGWRVLADASADVPDAYVERTSLRSKDFEAELETGDLEYAFEQGDAEHLTEPLFTDPEQASAARDEEPIEPEWEPQLWEEAEESEGIESSEFEHGETGVLLEDEYSPEPPLEAETRETHELPSGAALGIETDEDRPPDESPDEEVGSELDPGLVALAERIAAAPHRLLQGEVPLSKQRWTPCFSPDEIERLRELYRANDTAAAANPCDRAACIVILNAAIGRLLPLRTTNRVARGKTEKCPNGSSRTLRMGTLSTSTMEKAMGQLERSGLARPPVRIDFLDERGRTAGTLKPQRLKSSVRDRVRALSEPAGCWHAFGLSIMHDYHTVLLLVDRTGDIPTIYWLDQFQPDITLDVTAELDDRITTKTQNWWQAVMDDKHKGYDTVVRVWPLGRPVPDYESEPTSGSLRLGHKGPRTRALQAALQAQSQLAAAADGYFGYGTDRALREFQHAKGLVDDGIAGSRTSKLLNRLMTKPAIELSNLVLKVVDQRD